MIVFDLKCGAGHRFEGWFSSADDFERQRSGGLLDCPSCGSAHVERVPSATRINTGAAAKPQPPSEAQGKDAFALAQILYSRMLDELLSGSEDVGQHFPEEARRIFYEEAPARSIRGVATSDEHAALVEEGIPVVKLPVPPRDRLS